MLEFMIPILKISASGGSYLQRTLFKPPQNLALISLEYLNPFCGEATGNKASPKREMQKSTGKKSNDKRKRAADKDTTMMSFAMFCPTCANQTAYLKHTFHTVCQQLLFHLLFAPFAKAKILIPISRNAKRKAGNKQFSSRWLLNASQRAPLTPLYANPHSRPQRGEGGPGQAAGRTGWAGASTGAGVGSLAAPRQARSFLRGRLAPHICHVPPTPLSVL